MFKAMLLSIQPQNVVNIRSGYKIEELRKVIPKYLDRIIKSRGGIWCYIYETLGKTRYVNNDELWGGVRL